MHTKKLFRLASLIVAFIFAVDVASEATVVGDPNNFDALGYRSLADGGNGAPVSNDASVQPVQGEAAAAAVPAGQTVGAPTWVKVIKTTTRNVKHDALNDPVSDDDSDSPELAYVQTQWSLLQAGAKLDQFQDALQNREEDMGDDSENVSRSYEFYSYAGSADTLDGETGEAVCTKVHPTTDPDNPNYLHGIGEQVAVNDADGETYDVDCSAEVVVGNYLGTQIADHAAAAPLRFVDQLQDGASGTAYTPKAVVTGGTPPYAISIASGSLPPGLTIGDFTDPQKAQPVHAVLSGTPTQAGNFAFMVNVTDAGGASASGGYTLHINGSAAAQYTLTVTVSEYGKVRINSGEIDCSKKCFKTFTAGTPVMLAAEPAKGHTFLGWGGACSGTELTCTLPLASDQSVTALFD